MFAVPRAEAASTAFSILAEHCPEETPPISSHGTHEESFSLTLISSEWAGGSRHRGSNQTARVRRLLDKEDSWTNKRAGKKMDRGNNMSPDP